MYTLFLLNLNHTLEIVLEPYTRWAIYCLILLEKLCRTF
jgi:hypothetical protein